MTCSFVIPDWLLCLFTLSIASCSSFAHPYIHPSLPLPSLPPGPCGLICVIALGYDVTMFHAFAGPISLAHIQTLYKLASLTDHYLFVNYASMLLIVILLSE